MVVLKSLSDWGISADGLITINAGGGGDIDVSAITGAGGFTFNGEYAKADAYFNTEEGIDLASGDVTLQFGSGENAFFSASSVQTVSAFTFNGSSLATADIVLGYLSASESISFSSLGNAAGTAQMSAVMTEGNFTFNAGDSGDLDVQINGELLASAVSMVLGNSDSVAISDGCPNYRSQWSLVWRNLLGKYHLGKCYHCYHGRQC